MENKALFETISGFKVTDKTWLKYQKLLNDFGYSEDPNSVRMLALLRQQTNRLEYALEALALYKKTKVYYDKNKIGLIFHLVDELKIPSMTVARWFVKAGIYSQNLTDYQLNLVLMHLYIYTKKGS